MGARDRGLDWWIMDACLGIRSGKQDVPMAVSFWWSGDGTVALERTYGGDLVRMCGVVYAVKH